MKESALGAILRNEILRAVLTGGELRNGVNGFLTSYATDSVRFLQYITYVTIM